MLELHTLDIVIIVAYLLSTVLIGYWVSNRASAGFIPTRKTGRVAPTSRS